MKKEIITSVDPKSPVSEVFRALRTNLQYLNKRKGAQTILLTSTIQGEGKSFVAANLAVTFAQAGKNVIIVDTDMRRPRQNKIFNTDMYPGLSNYLSGVNIYRDSHEIAIEECIYKTDVENLSILPAGNIPPNPSELLQSENLPSLIDDLKKKYDVVIFDGAPCLLVTDATLVSRLVDATIMVCSQRKTKIEDLREATTRIKRVGGKVVGVVLNRVKVSSRKYGDKYYYYASNENEGSYRKRMAKRFKDKDDEYSYVKEDDENDYREAEEIEEEIHENTNEEKSEQENKKDNKSKKKESSSKKTKTVNADKIKEILDQINKVKEDKK